MWERSYYFTNNDDCDFLSRVEAIVSNPTLHLLYVGDVITERGARGVTEVISRNTHIRVLELHGAHDGFSRDPPTETTMTGLLMACASNPTLCRVGFQRTLITPSSLAAVTPVLAGNTSIAVLDLLSCQLGDEAAESLAYVISRNTTIRTLMISGNSFQATGLTRIADALKLNTALESLTIDAYDVGAKNAVSPFCEALRFNYHLQRLNLLAESVLANTVNAALTQRYRSLPRVRFLLRMRALCLGGRAEVAGELPVTWICERAPLWVLVRVAQLLFLF